MSEITVAARKFLQVFDYLARVGLDVEAIGRAVNLSQERIAELPPEERLPARQYSRLYKEGVKQMQTLKQPIPWAAGVGSESFELMCHCMISARTLRDALQLASRFERMVYPMIQHRVELFEEGDKATLSYHVRVSEEKSDLVPQGWERAGYRESISRASGLLIWHALCGWLVGHSLEADEVRIAAPYVNDEYAAGLDKVLRCPVRFDTQDNVMVFNAEQLERRLVHTPDSLREFLDNAVYELILIDKEPVSTSSAIRSLISIDLPAGMPSFTRISEHLHMSESSLRRRLQKENTSYQSLKDEVRCQIAVDKLVHEEATVADLADFLGFTEPSSFVRSFKSWTGDTPRSYRDKMQALGLH
jgi:AraC-like DNA-binding protein